MSIKEKIQKQISQFSENCIFTTKELSFEKKEAYSVANALSILCKENKINRLSRGVYFLPQKSSLLNLSLPPNTGKIVDFF